MSYRDQVSLRGHKERSIGCSKKVGYESSSTSKMSLDNAKFFEKIDLLIESKVDEKLKPVLTKVAELEAENRRVKIALRFLESELKELTKSNRNNLNAKSSMSDSKKRFTVDEEVSEMPESDPKKLKLLEDELSGCKSMTLSSEKILSEYAKLPESIDKIQIAHEDKAKCHDSIGDASQNLVEPSNVTKNQLYLAIPSVKSSSLVPLILQHGNKGNHVKSRQASNVVNGTKASTDSAHPTVSSKSLNITSGGERQMGTPAVAVNYLKDFDDTSMEDDEIEVVSPPPPKSPLAVIDLSEDEDGDASGYDISEILPGPECHMHPLMTPVLPFVISDEKAMPPPTLKARTGRGKDGKKAVVLRMESKISGIQNLQYRVFSYFENESEPVKDRRWKQLTCIKVQSGRVCECTLTHLMEKVRYHFVVCLVQGNNRSRFSNCAPHVY